MMGRKPDYEAKVKPHLDEIRKAVEAGATVGEIARGLGVSESTVYKYKADIPEFAAVFARGRVKIVIEIKAALLKKALGYDYEEVRERIDSDGTRTGVREVYRRHMPASETAAAMLLRNYDKDWIDRDHATMDLKRREVELKEALAEANNFDLANGV